MRRLLAVLLWALTALAAAQDALVFIRPDRAGPQVPREIDPHPIWVTWGPKSDLNGLNRLLEPVTGYSWEVSTRDFSFQIAGGTPKLTAFRMWEFRGIFAARDRILGPGVGLLRLRTNGFSPSITPLTSSTETMGVHTSRVMLAEAGSWDEVAQIARRHRRTAVLEYPPDEYSLGHLWLFGESGWPLGVPRLGAIPGLLPSTEVGKLLVDPSVVHWDPAVPSSERALPWALARATSFGWIRLSLGVFFGLVFGFAVFSVGLDARSSSARTLLKAGALAPFAAFLAAYPARTLLGPEATLPLTAGLLVGLLAIERTISVQLPSLSSWAGSAFLALLSFAVAQIPWSVFENQLGTLFGLVAVALVGTLAALPEPPSMWTWPGRLLVLALALRLAEIQPNGLTVGGIWLLGACLICGESWLTNRRWISGLVALGWAVGIARRPDFAWEGMLGFDSDIGRPNLYDAFVTLTGPLFIVVMTASFGLAVFATEYLRHRTRRTFLATPRLRGAWQLAALSSPLLVLEPSLSQAVPVLVAGAAALTLLAALEG
ncbi:hypothetical protein EON81_11260 [bacterium]|nr:MAG: hypothetical protein EON81_11260 [bacterium]